MSKLRLAKSRQHLFLRPCLSWDGSEGPPARPFRDAPSQFLQRPNLLLTQAPRPLPFSNPARHPAPPIQSPDRGPPSL